MRTGKRKFPLTQPLPEERGRDPNDRPPRLATARQADDESVTKTSRKKLCGFRWFFAAFCGSRRWAGGHFGSDRRGWVRIGSNGCGCVGGRPEAIPGYLRLGGDGVRGHRNLSEVICNPRFFVRLT